MKRILSFFLFVIVSYILNAQQNINDVLFEQTYKKYEQKRYTETFPVFSQLANDGYSKAYGYMGLAYELGEGVEKNTALMCEWYDKAILSGQSWCGWRLGRYLADIGQHYLASYPLEFASNSTGFRGRASLLLGEMYENGLGVDKDQSKAIEYYKKAAKNSSTSIQAINALERLGGSLYDDSEFVDATEGMINGKSAKQLYDLGYDYHTGGIHDKNYPLAYAYFKASANMGYAEALEWMGYISTNENYPIRSEEQAKKYFDRAIEEYKKRAAEGHTSDYSEIGDFYRRGLGRDKDLIEASRWYQIGADLGDISCQLWLGQVLDELGKYQEALTQLELSGKQGQGWAAFLVGKMYEDGRKTDDKYVIRPDLKKAISWYQISARMSNYYAKMAKEALERLGYTIE